MFPLLLGCLQLVLQRHHTGLRVSQLVLQKSDLLPKLCPRVLFKKDHFLLSTLQGSLHLTHQIPLGSQLRRQQPFPLPQLLQLLPDARMGLFLHGQVLFQHLHLLLVCLAHPSPPFLFSVKLLLQHGHLLLNRLKLHTQPGLCLKLCPLQIVLDSLQIGEQRGVTFLFPHDVLVLGPETSGLLPQHVPLLSDPLKGHLCPRQRVPGGKEVLGRGGYAQLVFGERRGQLLVLVTKHLHFLTLGAALCLQQLVALIHILQLGDKLGVIQS